MLKRLFLNDKFILYVIIINVVVLFIGGFKLSVSQNLLLDILEHSFTLIFLFEMVFKMYEFGFGGYFKSNWNKFDFLLVILSVPSLITFAFNTGGTDITFLLVFRAFRVFKAFRFIRFIPGINDLIAGVKRALDASVFVFLVFTIYIFVVGILSFYLYKDISPDYFSTPLKALFSTFKVFTVEGWNVIPESITQNQSGFAEVLTNAYFVFILLTGGIFGLSLVNSIFVDAMVSDNNDDLEEKINRLEQKIDMLLAEKENRTK